VSGYGVQRRLSGWILMTVGPVRWMALKQSPQVGDSELLRPAGLLPLTYGRGPRLLTGTDVKQVEPRFLAASTPDCSPSCA
jgi:hypothetical protein